MLHLPPTAAASGGLSADADTGAGNSRTSNDDGISKGPNRATMEMRNAVFNDTDLQHM